jgi:hypothetical protein
MTSNCADPHHPNHKEYQEGITFGISDVARRHRHLIDQLFGWNNITGAYNNPYLAELDKAHDANNEAAKKAARDMAAAWHEGAIRGLHQSDGVEELRNQLFVGLKGGMI